MTEDVLRYAGFGVLAWLVVPLLSRVAHRLGATDPSPRARDVPERKRGQRPAPLVGGALLLLVVLALVAEGAWRPGTSVVVYALAAFAVGAVDDLLPDGLGPLSKALAQLLASAPLALAAWRGELGGLLAAVLGEGPSAAALAIVLSAACFNVVNTWDHADGVLGTFGAIALAVPPLGAVGGACAGLLARQLHGARPVPYFGDAGSHLVGALVLVEPSAWPFLAVPALDLARVLVVRLLRGAAPWVGDRRHFGHALAARGLGPAAIALVQAVALLGVGLALHFL
ncbi:MAG: hypothetical protein R3F34_18945 [Planctomycetota bacterium]